jgi:hypothetical protein
MSEGQLLAANPAEAPGVERRGTPRYPILQRCLVWPGPRGVEGWRCIAYNISPMGVGLTLPLPVQPGTVLEIEAWEFSRARPLRARVVRTAPVEFLWFCGCHFETPLAEHELRTWLKAPRG